MFILCVYFMMTCLLLEEMTYAELAKSYKKCALIVCIVQLHTKRWILLITLIEKVYNDAESRIAIALKIE